MTDRVYLRHSTDKQTDARQRHTHASPLAAGAPVYEDPAYSRRLSRDLAAFVSRVEPRVGGVQGRYA
ncbi:hypothetical protein [Streptosporangium canum]|uniref:hypothetical protein n=1 Tax=Streptosporangium canum TaxID=324952 RepID=UPI0037BA4F5A